MVVVPKLIQRNVGSAVSAIVLSSQTMEGRPMTTAGQAFLFTGELFFLSFAAILVIWFADKLRSNFFGKP